MERSLFKIIRNQSGTPKVSILLPTHKTGPEKLNDSVLLKKLGKEAAKKLKAEYGQKQAEGLIVKMNSLIESIDLRQSQEGLAIFINNSFGKVVRLPFAVKARVIIDDNFATRDLIRAINRGINYYVLSISAAFVRLFEAHRDNLAEITEGGFPFVNPLPRGSNLEESTSSKEKKLREYFNQVNKIFSQIYNHHPMQVVIAGVSKNIAIFREVSDLNSELIATIEGNHDSSSPHDLAKLIWPEVQRSMSEKRKEVFVMIDEATGKNRLVTGIEEVWKLAFQDRGELLVVDEEYHQAAEIGLNGSFIPAEFQANTSSIDDLVDVVAEKVVSTGGKVVFASKGSLKDLNQIALILKY